MNIGYIAVSGLRLADAELLDLGLDDFMRRSLSSNGVGVFAVTCGQKSANGSL